MIGMLLRRLIEHIFRVNALKAMLLIAIALGFVFGFGASSTVGQTALIVVGVLLSYVLLPSQQTPVWATKGPDLSRTVPEARLLEASSAIAEAIGIQAAASKGPAVDLAALRRYWESALDGFKDVINYPSRLLMDLRYHTTVTLRGSDAPIVRTTFAASRCVPNAVEGRVWFSFCSDAAALAAEFDEQDNGCLYREIVEVKPTETFDGWRRRVEGYSVRLTINGLPVDPLDTEHRIFDGDCSFCVRVPFRSEELTERFVPANLRVEFEAPIAMSSFPCKFTSYWVIGAAQVSFEVEGGEAAEVSIDEYISATARNVDVRPITGMLTRGWQIETGMDNVLPPGAGAVFTWTARRHQLLARPPGELLERLAAGSPLPTVATLPESRQPCESRLSPLVDLTDVEVLDAYAVLGILPSRTPRCRAEVAEALRKANFALPDGLTLVVLDAYRTVAEQTTLLSYYARQGPTEGFVAAVNENAPRPPHTTGGAIDLTLKFQGRPLALGTDFDSFLADAAYMAFEDDDSLIRRLRRALAAALSDAGFVGHPLEWWHWSLGDDLWAASRGCSAWFDVVENEVSTDAPS